MWTGGQGLFLGGQDLVVLWASQSGAEVLWGSRGLGWRVPPVPEWMGTVLTSATSTGQTILAMAPFAPFGQLPPRNGPCLSRKKGPGGEL